MVVKEFERHFLEERDGFLVVALGEIFGADEVVEVVLIVFYLSPEPFGKFVAGGEFVVKILCLCGGKVATGDVGSQAE